MFLETIISDHITNLLVGREMDLIKNLLAVSHEPYVTKQLYVAQWLEYKQHVLISIQCPPPSPNHSPPNHFLN